MSGAAIRVVLADDHPIVLDGLELLFKGEPDIAVIARCVNAEEAIRTVVETSPDVLVLDVAMPAPGGLAVLREIRRRQLPTRVVLLTASISEPQVFEALRNDARGIVLKETAPRLLVECIRAVAAGRQWLEGVSVAKALEGGLKREARGREASSKLTDRELEIVRMVTQGLRNKEIARRLLITEGTVKVHLHTIYEKLNLDGRMTLSIWARENGVS